MSRTFLGRDFGSKTYTMYIYYKLRERYYDNGEAKTDTSMPINGKRIAISMFDANVRLREIEGKVPGVAYLIELIELPHHHITHIKTVR